MRPSEELSPDDTLDLHPVDWPRIESRDDWLVLADWHDERGDEVRADACREIAQWWRGSNRDKK